MKRSIVLRFFLLLCITTTAYDTIAMEANNDACYLFCLHREILNHIAHMLWESQEEFTERIALEKPIPKHYISWFNFDFTIKECSVGSYSKRSLRGVFCPDNSKIALCELFCGDCFAPKLMIIDAQKEHKKDAILYEGRLGHRCYQALGLSRDGDMIAVIERQPIVSRSRHFGLMDRRLIPVNNVLAIHKVAQLDVFTKLNKSKREDVLEFPLENGFVATDIDFNKQGTCVAVRGNDVTNMPEPCKKTVIFSLKNKIDGFTLKDAKEENNNLLQEYFRHKRVCKNVANITYT